MAQTLTTSSTQAGGTTIYTPITTNGEYELILDSTKNYVFYISKLQDTAVIVETTMNDVNGILESFSINDTREGIFIDKRNKILFKISNILVEVKIQSYIK
jgi:hypothetical protein